MAKFHREAKVVRDSHLNLDFRMKGNGKLVDFENHKAKKKSELNMFESNLK